MPQHMWWPIPDVVTILRPLCSPCTGWKFLKEYSLEEYCNRVNLVQSFSKAFIFAPSIHLLHAIEGYAALAKPVVKLVQLRLWCTACSVTKSLQDSKRPATSRHHSSFLNWHDLNIVSLISNVCTGYQSFNSICLGSHITGAPQRKKWVFVWPNNTSATLLPRCTSYLNRSNSF